MTSNINSLKKLEVALPGMKILIATWGNPEAWKETNYNYENTSMKSYSSLPLLNQVINPELLVIVGVETLAAADISPETVSYKDVNNIAANKIMSFCLSKIYLKSAPEVIICPGAGQFRNSRGNTVNFMGNIQDFYYFLFARLMKLLIEKFIEPNLPGRLPEIEIHLDLTHGINYMPTLTYRALKEISSLLELIYNVKFYVYNSEPFINIPDSVLNIHLIEKSEKLTPSIPHDYLEGPHLKLLTPIDQDNLLKRAISGITEGIMEPVDLNVFLSSLIYGLPLALLTWLPDSDKVLQALSKSEELFSHNISIESACNSIQIKRKLGFTEHYSVLNKIWLLINLLKKKEILKNETELALSKFRDFKDILFSKFPQICSIISNEWHYIENKIKPKAQSDWQHLCKITDDKGPCPIDQRNFIAHAGLERNITMARKRDDGELLLKYDSNQYNQIKKIASRALKFEN